MDNNEKQNVNTPETELERVRKIANSTQALRLGNDITTIAEELIVDSSKNVRLPEEVFVEYFLPVFASDKNTFNINGQELPRSHFFKKWEELAGSKFSEVDIIDQDENVIYTVPPLYRRDLVENKKLEDINFKGIVYKTIKQSSIIPTLGLNYLSAEIAKLPAFIKNMETTDDIQRWVSIFKRYKKEEDGSYSIPIKEELPTNDNNNVQEDTAPKVVNLDLDYDE